MKPIHEKTWNCVPNPKIIERPPTIMAINKTRMGKSMPLSQYGQFLIFILIGCGPTLDYTAYYPLYNAESLILISQIARDDSYLSGNTNNIENDKYGNQHPLSLHPIIPSSGAAKKGPTACSLVG
jgi:hypothetical protein